MLLKIMIKLMKVYGDTMLKKLILVLFIILVAVILYSLNLKGIFIFYIILMIFFTIINLLLKSFNDNILDKDNKDDI